MKTIFLLIAIFSISMLAQTRAYKLDNYRSIWYDSLYSTSKSKTIDLEMKYPNISIVFVNKSATITDSLKLFSVTKGYKTTYPQYAVSFALSAIWLKDAAGKSVSSDLVITVAPSSTKEFVIVNYAMQLMEHRLLNTNANAKAYFYMRGVKDVPD